MLQISSLLWGLLFLVPVFCDPSCSGSASDATGVLKFQNPSSKATKLNCTGVLISPRNALTSASCINIYGWNLTDIRVGEDAYESQSESLNQPIDKVVLHDFLDVALLRLRNSLPDARPACLPTKELSETDFSQKELEVVGYGGETSVASVSESSVGLSREACKREFNNFRTISENEVCAKGSKGKRLSNIGGHLFVDRYLVGVHSYGNPFAGQYEQPGVFTLVSKLASWIQEESA